MSTSGKKPSREAVRERGTAELLLYGLGASASVNPAGARAVRGPFDLLDAEAQAVIKARHGLFERWQSMANVTLPQVAWLCLGMDPFQADYPCTERDLRARHRAVVNALECEVAALRLKPISKPLGSSLPRFQLIEAAQIIRASGLERETVEHLVSVLDAPDLTAHGAAAWQSEQVTDRLRIHELLVIQYQSINPKVIAPISQKPARRGQRVAKCKPINVRLAVREQAYNLAFRELFAREMNGEPGYELTDEMLRKDRDQLNIKFYGGRPKGSTTKR